MQEDEAVRQTVLTLLDVVEGLAKQASETEWSEAVYATFAAHRHELADSVPDRLVDACGGSEEAARAVLRVLARATAQRSRAERPSEAAMREAFGPPPRARVTIVPDEVS